MSNMGASDRHMGDAHAVLIAPTLWATRWSAQCRMRAVWCCRGESQGWPFLDGRPHSGLPSCSTNGTSPSLGRWSSIVWRQLWAKVKVIYSTNAIESLNARFRRATRARGHFPNEQAAMKCLYMVVRSLDPTGSGQERWMNRWKPALNAFAVTSEGRLF